MHITLLLIHIAGSFSRSRQKKENPWILGISPYWTYPCCNIVPELILPESSNFINAKLGFGSFDTVTKAYFAGLATRNLLSVRLYGPVSGRYEILCALGTLCNLATSLFVPL